ncbi:MAG TPA: 2-C-methyl-D-erythritol 2,4-cyclodiphosphate synthase [Longimicrobiales bacterium]|nr:2-C-methyl-D-erythritol 2,4-cyclodiphosphate synthase [Longimicrobiales bacterium]
MRVGIGYDSHRFAAGRPLVLGGVVIEHPRGLAGHSDADAVAHALTDAILGAAGAGDIGAHFPPGDARWQDADSLALLRSAVAIIAEQNYQVVNVDVTVICEAPRIGPHVAAMRDRIARAVGIAPRLVSVKGKSNEGMGWVGRGEGIAAIAVAAVDAIAD